MLPKNRAVVTLEILDEVEISICFLHKKRACIAVVTLEILDEVEIPDFSKKVGDLG